MQQPMEKHRRFKRMLPANPRSAVPPLSVLKGAAVMQWLERPPPHEANRVRFPAGLLPEFSNRGFAPDDFAGQWVFSGFSRSPRLLAFHRYSIRTSPHTQEPVREAGFPLASVRKRKVTSCVRGSPETTPACSRPGFSHCRSDYALPACSRWTTRALGGRRFGISSGACLTAEQTLQYLWGEDRRTRGHAKFALLLGIMLNFTVLYALEPAPCLHWLLHRREDTPSLTELHVIEARSCEVFLYWCRVTQGVTYADCSVEDFETLTFFTYGVFQGTFAASVPVVTITDAAVFQGTFAASVPVVAITDTAVFQGTFAASVPVLAITDAAVFQGTFAASVPVVAITDAAVFQGTFAASVPVVAITDAAVFRKQHVTPLLTAQAYRIHFLFPCKSIIGAESSRACLVISDPIAKKKRRAFWQGRYRICCYDRGMIRDLARSLDTWVAVEQQNIARPSRRRADKRARDVLASDWLLRAAKDSLLARSPVWRARDVLASDWLLRAAKDSLLARSPAGEPGTSSRLIGYCVPRKIPYWLGVRSGEPGTSSRLIGYCVPRKIPYWLGVRSGEPGTSSRLIGYCVPRKIPYWLGVRSGEPGTSSRLIGYCVPRKIPYWLGVRQASRNETLYPVCLRAWKIPLPAATPASFFLINPSPCNSVDRVNKNLNALVFEGRGRTSRATAHAQYKAETQLLDWSRDIESSRRFAARRDSYQQKRRLPFSKQAFPKWLEVLTMRDPNRPCMPAWRATVSRRCSSRPFIKNRAPEEGLAKEDAALCALHCFFVRLSSQLLSYALNIPSHIGSSVEFRRNNTLVVEIKGNQLLVNSICYCFRFDIRDLDYRATNLSAGALSYTTLIIILKSISSLTEVLSAAKMENILLINVFSRSTFQTSHMHAISSQAFHLLWSYISTTVLLRRGQAMSITLARADTALKPLQSLGRGHKLSTPRGHETMPDVSQPSRGQDNRRRSYRGPPPRRDEKQTSASTIRRNKYQNAASVIPVRLGTKSLRSTVSGSDRRCLFFSLSRHGDTGDNNTRDQRPVAPTHKAHLMNLRATLPLFHFPRAPDRGKACSLFKCTRTLLCGDCRAGVEQSFSQRPIEGRRVHYSSVPEHYCVETARAPDRGQACSLVKCTRTLLCGDCRAGAEQSFSARPIEGRRVHYSSVPEHYCLETVNTTVWDCRAGAEQSFSARPIEGRRVHYSSVPEHYCVGTVVPAWNRALRAQDRGQACSLFKCTRTLLCGDCRAGVEQSLSARTIEGRRVHYSSVPEHYCVGTVVPAAGVFIIQVYQNTTVWDCRAGAEQSFSAPDRGQACSLFKCTRTLLCMDCRALVEQSFSARPIEGRRVHYSSIPEHYCVGTVVPATLLWDCRAGVEQSLSARTIEGRRVHYSSVPEHYYRAPDRVQACSLFKCTRTLLWDCRAGAEQSFSARPIEGRRVHYSSVPEHYCVETVVPATLLCGDCRAGVEQSFSARPIEGRRVHYSSIPEHYCVGTVVPAWNRALRAPDRGQACSLFKCTRTLLCGDCRAGVEQIFSARPIEGRRVYYSIYQNTSVWDCRAGVEQSCSARPIEDCRAGVEQSFSARAIEVRRVHYSSVPEHYCGDYRAGAEQSFSARPIEGRRVFIIQVYQNTTVWRLSCRRGTELYRAPDRGQACSLFKCTRTLLCGDCRTGVEQSFSARPIEGRRVHYSSVPEHYCVETVVPATLLCGDCRAGAEQSFSARPIEGRRVHYSSVPEHYCVGTVVPAWNRALRAPDRGQACSLFKCTRTLLCGDCRAGVEQSFSARPLEGRRVHYSSVPGHYCVETVVPAWNRALARRAPDRGQACSLFKYTRTLLCGDCRAGVEQSLSARTIEGRRVHYSSVPEHYCGDCRAGVEQSFSARPIEGRRVHYSSVPEHYCVGTVVPAWNRALAREQIEGRRVHYSSIPKTLLCGDCRAGVEQSLARAPIEGRRRAPDRGQACSLFKCTRTLLCGDCRAGVEQSFSARPIEGKACSLFKCTRTLLCGDCRAGVEQSFSARPIEGRRVHYSSVPEHYCRAGVFIIQVYQNTTVWDCRAGVEQSFSSRPIEGRRVHYSSVPEHYCDCRTGRAKIEGRRVHYSSVPEHYCVETVVPLEQSFSARPIEGRRVHYSSVPEHYYREGVFIIQVYQNITVWGLSCRRGTELSAPDRGQACSLFKCIRTLLCGDCRAGVEQSFSARPIEGRRVHYSSVPEHYCVETVVPAWNRALARARRGQACSLFKCTRHTVLDCRAGNTTVWDCRAGAEQSFSARPIEAGVINIQVYQNTTVWDCRAGVEQSFSVRKIEAGVFIIQVYQNTTVWGLSCRRGTEPLRSHDRGQACSLFKCTRTLLCGDCRAGVEQSFSSRPIEGRRVHYSSVPEHYCGTVVPRGTELSSAPIEAGVFIIQAYQNTTRAGVFIIQVYQNTTVWDCRAGVERALERAYRGQACSLFKCTRTLLCGDCRAGVEQSFSARQIEGRRVHYSSVPGHYCVETVVPAWNRALARRAPDRGQACSLFKRTRTLLCGDCRAGVEQSFSARPIEAGRVHYSSVPGHYCVETVVPAWNRALARRAPDRGQACSLFKCTRTLLCGDCRAGVEQSFSARPIEGRRVHYSSVPEHYCVGTVVPVAGVFIIQVYQNTTVWGLSCRREQSFSARPIEGRRVHYSSVPEHYCVETVVPAAGVFIIQVYQNTTVWDCRAGVEQSFSARTIEGRRVHYSSVPEHYCVGTVVPATLLCGDCRAGVEQSFSARPIEGRRVHYSSVPEHYCVGTVVPAWNRALARADRGQACSLFKYTRTLCVGTVVPAYQNTTVWDCRAGGKQSFSARPIEGRRFIIQVYQNILCGDCRAGVEQSFSARPIEGRRVHYSSIPEHYCVGTVVPAARPIEGRRVHYSSVPEHYCVETVVPAWNRALARADRGQACSLFKYTRTLCVWDCRAGVNRALARAPIEGRRVHYSSVPEHYCVGLSCRREQSFSARPIEGRRVHYSSVPEHTVWDCRAGPRPIEGRRVHYSSVPEHYCGDCRAGVEQSLSARTIEGRRVIIQVYQNTTVWDCRAGAEQIFSARPIEGRRVHYSSVPDTYCVGTVVPAWNRALARAR
ncbi:hypothetical protein PR048_004043 [Dryococelus australis]|uniref:Uncharacterized protein n=1 Tax=Dryococelus australis TaxID=614101 RepID=A0ABQ9I4F7_9NEOP|nr:hypothetical protein PR048_004043 [Dryococelus australis]